jgi:hypothetical protein
MSNHSGSPTPAGTHVPGWCCISRGRQEREGCSLDEQAQARAEP